MPLELSHLASLSHLRQRKVAVQVKTDILAATQNAKHWIIQRVNALEWRRKWYCFPVNLDKKNNLSRIGYLDSLENIDNFFTTNPTLSLVAMMLPYRKGERFSTRLEDHNRQCVNV